MEGLLKNMEVKDTLIKLMLLQLGLLIALFMFQVININSIEKDVVMSQVAMVGSLLKNHPELESEIIPSITKEVKSEDAEFGLMTLSSYGYNTKMAFNSEPSIQRNTKKMSLILLGIFLAHLILLTLLLLKGYGLLFSRVREITLSIKEILKGNFSRNILEEEEGDFSVLGHYYNSMLQMINQNLETLREERSFLKDILSDISHQLKTPMSSLMMLNDLLIEDGNMTDETRKDFLNRTKLQLNRMNWLIKSLLKIARLEARAINFKGEEVLLIKVVEGAIEPLRIPAELKNISIDVVDSKNASFLGDSDWTKEAVLNIVKNCIEHTGDGGSIKIELSSTPLSSTILIKDNGEGISKSDIPHIFERFYKGSNSTKDDSIGIGLAMSKSIVESQGGEIRVKSEVREGTEFNITFIRGVI